MQITASSPQPREAHWREVPAHRVYIVPALDVRAQYERINANGAVTGDPYERHVFRRRMSDGKLFRDAPYWPADLSDVDMIALVEA